MEQLGEMVPSARLLAFLEKLETAAICVSRERRYANTSPTFQSGTAEGGT